MVLHITVNQFTSTAVSLDVVVAAASAVIWAPENANDLEFVLSASLFMRFIDIFELNKGDADIWGCVLRFAFV